MARLIRKTVFGGLLSLGFVASFAFAGTKTLSPQEARAVAWRALQAGKPHITLQIADVLAQKTADDFELALLRAEALRAMGQKAQAVKAAHTTWKQAQTQGQRFDAAHLVAKAHFANEQQMRAQFWLRRAEQNAPNAQAREIAVRDFHYVRRIKPVSTQFNFSIFPSSNINNGSPNSDIVINGIEFQVPTSGLPHSGTGMTFGFHTTYNKPLNQSTKVRLGFKASSTLYRLSDSAKALGSGKKGSDYAYGVVEFQAGLTFYPKGKATTGFGATNVDVAIGHNWYGGSALSRYGRVAVSQDFYLSKRSLVRLKAGVERQVRQDNAASSATVKTIGLDFAHGFKNKSRLRYGIGYRDTASKSNIVDSTAVSAHVSYTLAPVAMDIVPTFSLGYQETDYARLVVGTTQRRDKKITAGVSVFFPKASYYGFAPTVNVNASRNDSSVSIYSTKDLRMSLGFQSTF